MCLAELLRSLPGCPLGGITMAEQRDFVGCYYGLLFCDSVRNSSAMVSLQQQLFHDQRMLVACSWALERKKSAEF